MFKCIYCDQDAGDDYNDLAGVCHSCWEVLNRPPKQEEEKEER